MQARARICARACIQARARMYARARAPRNVMESQVLVLSRACLQESRECHGIPCTYLVTRLFAGNVMESHVPVLSRACLQGMSRNPMYLSCHAPVCRDPRYIMEFHGICEFCESSGFAEFYDFDECRRARICARACTQARAYVRDRHVQGLRACPYSPNAS